MFKILSSLNVHQYINSTNNIDFHVENEALIILRKNLKNSFDYLADEEYQRIDTFLEGIINKKYGKI
jgi:hypothetical protein